MKTKVIFLAAFLLSSMFLFSQTPTTKATEGQADVYILCLSGVSGHWRNPQRVKEGAIKAIKPYGARCDSSNIPLVHPRFGTSPPFLGISYEVISDWNTYRQIVESYKDIIIINTHDEILPVPSGYSRESWTDKIAEAMLERQVSWVHVSGYPFFYVWLQGSSSFQLWGAAGFQRLMQHVNKGGVTIPYLDGTEKPGLTGAAEKNLGIPELVYTGWDGIYEAKAISEDRPLRRSDFQDYTVLSIWEAADYYDGAVVAFVKPNEEVPVQTRNGFGFYVHIGTNHTYRMEYNELVPTDTDLSCGYVGCAAAIWATTTGFEGISSSTSYLAGNVNFTLHVTPVVTDYSWDYLNQKWNVHIAFFILGGLRRPYYSGISIDKIGFYATPELPTSGGGFSLTPYDDFCSNAHPDHSATVIDIGTRVGTSFLKTATFAFSLIDPTHITKAISLMWLIADWSRNLVFTPHHQTNTEVNVDFYVDPEETSEGNGQYDALQFQSVFAVTLELDRDPYFEEAREGWRIIPLHWGVELFPTNLPQGYETIVGDSTELAIYFPHWQQTDYRPTVFFDDFRDTADQYQCGDSNPASGADYWGSRQYGYSLPGGSPTFPGGYCFWCANVGHNSIYDQPNVDAFSYDKNMDAYLQKELDLRPYKSDVSIYYCVSICDLRQGDSLMVYIRDEAMTWILFHIITSDKTRQVCILNGVYSTDNAIKFVFHSNDDSNVGIEATIYYIEIRATIPNDADTGADAGDTLTTATNINTMLNFSGFLDDEDYYKSTVTRGTGWGEEIRFEVCSPEGALFNIELYNSANQKIAGPAEMIEMHILAGTYKMRIFGVVGFGQYKLKTTYVGQSGGGGGGGAHPNSPGR